MQLKSKKKGKKVRASWGRCFAFTAVQMHCICCWRDIIFYLIHHYCVCESQHVCLYLTVSTTRGSTLFLFTLPHIGCLLHFLTANKHVDCFGGLLMKAFSNESIGWLLKGSRTDHSRERERERETLCPLYKCRERSVVGLVSVIVLMCWCTFALVCISVYHVALM